MDDRHNWEWSFTVGAATDIDRAAIELGTRQLIASDACVLIKFGDLLLGWGDDYGTFHPVCRLGQLVKEAAERFLVALLDLASAIQ
jgi:hypothetical protein